MRFTHAFAAVALLGLAGCGGEREAEEPAIAEEGIGEREGVVDEGEAGEEGLIAGEEREVEGEVGAVGGEREE